MNTELLILIIALLIVAGVCLGLLIALAISILSKQFTVPSQTTNNSPPSNQSDIINKLDKMRLEQLRDKRENICYVLWGFTLAMLGLTIANPHPAIIVATILFLVLGWVMWFRARLVKVG